MRHNKKRVCAIVPAHNEALRISNVLKVLLNSKSLDEIMVIDDGSVDDTKKILKKFPSIKLIVLEKNYGKAHAMEVGVQNTNADIIFFCDADLEGLTTDIISEIINPVVKGKYDMFIGLRNNFTQKMWRYTALCSGERALIRELWEKLPQFYKKGYRIESGLNEFSKLVGKGYGYKLFDYYQTTSEVKRGIFNGLKFRIKMFYGVFSGMLMFKFYHRFKVKRNLKHK